MMRARPDFRRAEGFTLVELLVVLLLLGLISVALFGGLRFTGRVWERASATGATIDTVEATQSFLRRYLAQGEAFEGDGKALVFTAPVAPHHGIGGIYAFRLWLDDTDDAGRLLTAWMPARADADAERFERSTPLVLLEGVRSLDIRYFGTLPGDSAAAWQETWEHPRASPQLVRITLTFSGESAYQWPVMTVAPLLD